MRTCVAAFAAAVLAVSAAAAAEPIKVMVLGTYHMGNPGQDLANVEADDVTTPKRQKELEEVAERLAAFAPTKIAIEARPTRDDFTSEKYPLFKPKELKTNPDERVQVGYRLARKLRHENVYTIDEQSDAIDYFPYGAVAAYAEETGRKSDLDATLADVQAMVKAFGDSQGEKSVRELLVEQNSHAYTDGGHGAFYYGLLDFADRERQPGAELNAYWYMRNAKIFAKLMQIAEPGDRIVVLFGSGHNYWLRHFAQTTPGFELVEPNDYLDD